MPSSQPETKKSKLTKKTCTEYKQGSMRVTVAEDGNWDVSLYVNNENDATDAIAVLEAARFQQLTPDNPSTGRA